LIRIAICDDEKHMSDHIRAMASDFFRKKNREIQLRTFSSGEELLSYDGQIDILFLDIQMKGMDGIETARKIRSAVGKEAPIIILTAYDWTDIEEEAKEAGVTAFCAKPLFMSDLKSALLAANNMLEKDEEAAAWTLADFGGKRVLLVEDIELNREIAEVILEEAGFVIESAPDGTDAVAMIENSEEGYYDAVLMDVQMPVMNGYDATRAIRALPRSGAAAIPIIAMTANAFAEDEKEALNAGMNVHLAKPINVELLKQVIRQYTKSGNAK